MMHNLALRYPEYGWDRNAGYATREHRDAIRAHGLTPHHRRSWQAIQVLLAGDQLGLFDPEAANPADASEAMDDDAAFLAAAGAGELDGGPDGGQRSRVGRRRPARGGRA